MQVDLLERSREFILDTDKNWNYILPNDFYRKYYKSNKKYLLIDLRDKKSYNKFHIKNAINIFWMDILKDNNIKKLPKNQKIFLICYVGHTSSQIVVLLRLLGYNAVSIKFGYGISPMLGVPVAGWINYNYPVI